MCALKWETWEEDLPDSFWPHLILSHWSGSNLDLFLSAFPSPTSSSILLTDISTKWYRYHPFCFPGHVIIISSCITVNNQLNNLSPVHSIVWSTDAWLFPNVQLSSCDGSESTEGTSLYINLRINVSPWILIWLQLSSQCYLRLLFCTFPTLQPDCSS